jgi:hypothetical protein
VCSQHGVTWQTDAIGSRKCDLDLPSFTEAVTTITVRELSNSTSYRDTSSNKEESVSSRKYALCKPVRQACITCSPIM